MLEQIYRGYQILNGENIINRRRQKKLGIWPLRRACKRAPAGHKRGYFLRLDQRKWPDVNWGKRILWENPPLGLAKSFLCMRNRRKNSFCPAKIFPFPDKTKDASPGCQVMPGRFILRVKPRPIRRVCGRAADLMFFSRIPPIVRAVRGRTGCPLSSSFQNGNSILFQAVRKADPERVPAHRTAATRRFLP